MQQQPNRPAMKVPLAWRILTNDKRRTALALVGIFMAILLVFVELGFFYAVPRGGLLLYDNMRFDLLLASNQYEYQAQPGAFPLSQLEKVRSSPDVAEATPIYFGFAKWKSGEGDLWPDIFVIGYDPARHIFIPDSINRQAAVLDRVDTVLVDSSTRPIFGPLGTGRVVELDDRKVTIGGQYALGTGFMGLGVALASTANFARLFPQRGSTIVNLGAIRLKAGVDPDRAAGVLQKLTGARIFTRQELEAHETAYWTTRTSVGIIFGSGLLISLVVGIMIVYQIVSTQVGRQLPQFATLKAIGYRDRALAATVSAMSLLIVIAGFIPALAAALGLYALIRQKTLLPVMMSEMRLLAVFAASLGMAVISALLSVWALRRADPADVF
ncbi:MAG TPA: FtsX-like permease family protein [Steroidobacteraceae bacterium]|nr:FtsX-like permease family protein [Steroidobacteraceae bacterium]